MPAEGCVNELMARLGVAKLTALILTTYHVKYLREEITVGKAKKVSTATKELWAAYNHAKADSDAFVDAVTHRFGAINPRLPYEHCRLKAEGFYEAVSRIPTGEMQFKLMWEDYCENLKAAAV